MTPQSHQSPERVRILQELAVHLRAMLAMMEMTPESFARRGGFPPHECAAWFRGEREMPMLAAAYLFGLYHDLWIGIPRNPDKPER